MDNAQLITVTVEIPADVTAEEAVTAINAHTTPHGYYIGQTAGTPAHAVEGEPYRAGRPGKDVTVGTVTLVSAE